MSVKLAILPQTLTGLGRAGLRSYLSQHHGPLVMAHADVSGGFRAYVHHYALDEADPVFAAPALEGRDALTIIRFAQIADMIASKASAGYRDVVGPDEDNFRELDGSVAMLLAESVVRAGGDSAARKLFVFRPGVEADPALAQSWADSVAQVLASHPAEAIAAWRVNTVVRVAEGTPPGLIFDEIALDGPVPPALADALRDAARRQFPHGAALSLCSAPLVFVPLQKD
ncbi:hypothetical protein GTZ99_00295 [Novosphingobium sp. FSY-8]|uniref:EthD domain-containing protein n=1 Tax=Novosphingobium ovatum TaxID=1908523 RepID=A0ABW9X8Y9_9SPHN|nr:EthD domain-containing protein [Novosphingobium ovatum]NBC34993.1 hypothetical protein [Novosphingobium ovatum]